MHSYHQTCDSTEFIFLDSQDQENSSINQVVQFSREIELASGEDCEDSVEKAKEPNDYQDFLCLNIHINIIEDDMGIFSETINKCP